MRDGEYIVDDFFAGLYEIAEEMARMERQFEQEK